MEVVMNWMKSLCYLSDETIRELEACVTPCRFPKRHLLVREGIFCKYAYFIEKGMTRSYWLSLCYNECAKRIEYMIEALPEGAVCFLTPFSPSKHGFDKNANSLRGV